MISIKIEMRVNVKFLDKFGKSTTVTYGLLIEVYISVYRVLKFFSDLRDL